MLERTDASQRRLSVQAHWRHTAQRFLKGNILAIAILVFSIVFALWQHSTGYSWDFSAYAVNARADGALFEWARPPLSSAIMFVLGGGSLMSEYLYIIFVSILFFYSSLALTKKYSISFVHYYALAMSFFTIINAFNVGTELLSLALLQLMIAYVNDGRAGKRSSAFSGLFFGLSLLTRYTNIAFVALFIFQRNVKKIVLSLFIAFLVLAPWLAFNYTYMGDPFFSIAESYALNIKYRTAIQPFNALDALLVMNFVLPLFVLGIVRFRKSLNRNNILMLVLFVLAIVFYIRTPVKEPRYMLAVIIPGAYFAAMFLSQHKNKIIKSLLYAIVAINIAAVLVLLPTTQLGSPSPYLNFIDNEKSNIDCAIRSNAWVSLGYYGAPSGIYPWQDALPNALENGYTVVLFKHNAEPAYLYNQSFVDKYKIVETPQYVILDDSALTPKGVGSPSNCKPADKRVEVSYLQTRAEGMFFANGTIFDKRSCAIFVSSSFCDFIGWKR